LEANGQRSDEMNAILVILGQRRCCNGRGRGTIHLSEKVILVLNPPVYLSNSVGDALPPKRNGGSAINNCHHCWGCPFQIVCTLSIGEM